MSSRGALAAGRLTAPTSDPKGLPLPEAVHPRPQLVRESFEDLCGEWDFAYDDADEGLAAGWHLPGAAAHVVSRSSTSREGTASPRPVEPDKTTSDPFDRTITVPFPPESKLSQIADPTFHPVLWYRREVAAPQLARNQRLLLHFGAVDYRARVWVDGALVGEHTGGHTPFTCDITDAVRQAEEESRAVAVVVRAEDQPRDVSQPRGKQDWELEPHDIWYHRTSGIWQQVWLEVVSSTYVAELQWTADLTAARVRAEVRLNRTPVGPLSVRVVLSLGDEVLAEHTTQVADELTTTDIAIPMLRHQRDRQRVLWRPKSPTLVDATVELRDSEGVLDEVTSYLGLRSVGIHDGQLQLNGRLLYLRSVLGQGYWPESHLAAPDADALRREVELVKELGFNAVRIHQKVEDPRFLYWCDRLGVLVWAEMPNAFAFDSRAVERLTAEWVEVLRRDRSHPCIVTWVPFNESWGIDDIATEPAHRSFALGVYQLTKAIDPTRPVIANDGWEMPDGDIWTVHDYVARGTKLQQRYGDREKVMRTLRKGQVHNRRLLLPDAVDRGQPVMLTEFGGVRYDSSGGTAKADGGWGYSQVGSADAFVKRLKQLVDAVLDSSALSGFCYTQLTDTEQEQNGLLTEHREPKAPVAQLRKIIARPRDIRTDTPHRRWLRRPRNEAVTKPR